MVEKKFIAIVLVCVALSVGLIGTTMALDQKDKETANQNVIKSRDLKTKNLL